MFKNNNKLVFHKLIAEIGGNFLDSTIRKYGGDYRTQHFDTRSHLNSMLYLNIKNCSSLREIKEETSSNKKLRKLINVPSISQFSRKNASRDYRIFEDIFYNLVGKARRKFGIVSQFKDLPPLKIVDSTVILVALKLAPYLQMDKDRAGVKISTMYNGEYPEKLNIVKGQVNDRKCIDEMFVDKGSVYIFDRGYYDYSWYDKLTAQDIKFVTRGIKNATIMEERIIDSDPQNDIYDTEIRLGATVSKNLTINTYREIMIFDEDGEPLTFITNIFDLSKEEILMIYKYRWQIELFFKWIKQHLKIKKFIGYNENAIRIQIFSALISYMLIYLLFKSAGKPNSMLALTRIIRSNLLEEIDEYFIEKLILI
jgi:hypothetical protein